MKHFVICCILILSVFINTNAQELNKTFFDKRVGYNILIDQCNRTGLEQSEFSKYFEKEYANYRYNDTIITKLSKYCKSIYIKIVLGTWCSDSKIQVPRFFKILDQIKFDEKNFTIICVDSYKSTHHYPIEDLDIKFVPTFIFYKNGKEIGRIVENPVDSLEKDFLDILK